VRGRISFLVRDRKLRRKFEDVDDHAGYLPNDGCRKIIEALAARPI
jgi:hypothetical protein